MIKAICEQIYVVDRLEYCEPQIPNETLVHQKNDPCICLRADRTTDRCNGPFDHANKTHYVHRRLCLFPVSADDIPVPNSRKLHTFCYEISISLQPKRIALTADWRVDRIMVTKQNAILSRTIFYVLVHILFYLCEILWLTKPVHQLVGSCKTPRPWNSIQSYQKPDFRSFFLW